MLQLANIAACRHKFIKNQFCIISLLADLAQSALVGWSKDELGKHKQKFNET